MIKNPVLQTAVSPSRSSYCSSGGQPLSLPPPPLSMPQVEYGIAFVHEGLSADERSAVSALHSSGAIQVLVATHSMCWGLPLQAHLAVLMDTQFYDGAEHRYADYPITDILQMIGRACRWARRRPLKPWRVWLPDAPLPSTPLHSAPLPVAPPSPSLPTPLASCRARAISLSLLLPSPLVLRPHASLLSSSPGFMCCVCVVAQPLLRM